LSAFEHDFTVATAHVDIYDKLEKEKLFKARHHLFAVGLAIGFMYNLHCDHQRGHDILRILTLRDSASRGIIDFFYGLCGAPSDQERWNELLAVGDGGIERLWGEYQLQNHLDVTRLLQESKQLWVERAEELKKRLEPSSK
jgi:hypothetical protein